MPVWLRRCMVRLRARSGGVRAAGQEGPRAVPVLAPVLIALIVGAVFLRFVDGQLRPVLETVAASRAVNLISRTIGEAVDDCLTAEGLDYGDFVTLETDESGRVTALNGGTAASGRFRRRVTEEIAGRLEKLDREELGIPLGNLTGELLLSGLGPTVRVSVYSVGDVSAELTSTFTGAGVNQTLHRLSLEVTATVYLFLPGEIMPVTADSSVPVAETVIVGEPPGAYLNMS